MKWNSPVRDKSAIPYKFLTFIYVKGKGESANGHGRHF
jgi:hypothetical protein